MHRALCIAIVAVALSLPTVRCAWGGSSETQADLTRQACDEYKQVDAALNDAYRELLRHGASDKKLSAAFEAAQRAWVTFRDAQKAALFTNRGQGTVTSMCACLAMTEMTKQRADQLQRMLTHEEGDVCSWERP